MPGRTHRQFAHWVRPCLSDGLLLSFLRRHLAAKEIADQRSHFGPVGLECEVAGVQQVQLNVLQITLVGRRTIGDEDLVILAPQYEHCRLVLAEVGLPLRIERHIGPVVVEEIELNLLVTGAIEEGLIVSPRVRADERQIRYAMCVLPLRRLQRCQPPCQTTNTSEWAPKISGDLRYRHCRSARSEQ
jgi:hypothetical protein